MPRDSVFEEIIEELAEEFRLNKKVVRFLVMTYYKEVRDIIREGDLYDLSTLKGVYMPGLGKFKVKSKRRVEYIRALKERRKNVQFFPGEKQEDRADTGRSDDS